MNQALGLLETLGCTPAMVALDAMEKAAPIRVLQAELNDLLGVIVKISGDAASVSSAIAVGTEVAKSMRTEVHSTVIPRVQADAWKAMDSASEYNQLIQQNVVHHNDNALSTNNDDDEAPSQSPVGDTTMSLALGFIETQGYTAVFDAVDSACKAAQVDVVGKEKLGGGYITVVVQGDVAAVHAAIDVAQQRASELGTLIAAHVIPNPSPNVLPLLTKIEP